MAFMTLPVSSHGKRAEERAEERLDAPDMSYMRQMSASAGYQVDFYLIYLAISVPGFTFAWTAPSRAPGESIPAGAASATDGGRHGGSDLRLVQDVSTVLTSSAATHAIQWDR